jgi:hypothetical protein
VLPAERRDRAVDRFDDDHGPRDARGARRGHGALEQRDPANDSQWLAVDAEPFAATGGEDHRGYVRSADGLRCVRARLRAALILAACKPTAEAPRFGHR